MILRQLTSVILLVSALVLDAQEVSAQDRGNLLKRKADEYFSKGEVMFESGEFAKAAAAFVLAYETYPVPAVLANIGLSYDKAGNIPKAVEALRFYLSQVPEDEVQKWVPGRLSYLEKQVGELSIECPVKDCIVYVDDVEYKDRMKPLIIAPGKHLVEGFAGRRLLERTNVNVKAGAMARIVIGTGGSSGESIFSDDEELEIGDDNSASPDGEVSPDGEAPIDGETPFDGEAQEMDFTTENDAPAGTEETPPRPKRKMILKAPFWISAGLTVVGTGMTIGFGVATNKTEKAFNNTTTDDAKKDRLASKGKKYKVATNAMIGVTLAAATATVVFAIIDSLRAKKKAKADSENSIVRLQPMLGPAIGFVGKF